MTDFVIYVGLYIYIYISLRVYEGPYIYGPSYTRNTCVTRFNAVLHNVCSDQLKMWGDLMKGSTYSAQVKLSKQRGVNQGTPQLPNDEDMGGGGFSP